MNLKEQTLFAKQLSYLSGAGLPILDSLALVRNQTTSPKRGRLLDIVINDVANGQFLSASFEKHSAFFGEFAINLIRVGEQGGMLAQNLAYLADELRKKQILERKIFAALVYPVFITIATLGITGMLIAYVFPKIMPIFSSLHVALPLSTRVLIGVSNYLQHWGIVTVLFLIIFSIGLVMLYKKVSSVRYFFDAFMLKLPFAGNIARAYNASNGCRTMGLLLQSGVQLNEALIITAQTTTNRVYKQAYENAAQSVAAGEAVSAGLARYKKLFPETLTHLVAIGETTGNLAGTFVYVSNMFEAQVDELTKNLSSAIEPLLMLIMGLLVGVVAISVITPVYEITQHLGPK